MFSQIMEVVSVYVVRVRVGNDILHDGVINLHINTRTHSSSLATLEGSIDPSLIVSKMLKLLLCAYKHLMQNLHTIKCRINKKKPSQFFTIYRIILQAILQTKIYNVP